MDCPCYVVTPVDYQPPNFVKGEHNFKHSEETVNIAAGEVATVGLQPIMLWSICVCIHHGTCHLHISCLFLCLCPFGLASWMW